MIGLLAQLIVPIFGFSAAALAQDETPVATDTTAPVVTVPADLAAVADASGTAVVTFDVAATDDVDGPLAPTCDWASGASFPVGDTVVTCTAADAAGNQGSASFTVSVSPAPDTTAPVVSAPGNLTATADDSGTAVVTFDASAIDDVGVVDLACDWPSGSAFPVGDTVVTCTATDAAGNQGSASFTVSASPAPAPTATDTPAPAPTNTPTPAPTAPPA
ncbi:MAG TPA: HYR domain-containing protein, partial [Thermomicrobiales bacterium]|nr:HYR domain-containing protein [Thermomicrobiales bacterium]